MDYIEIGIVIIVNLLLLGVTWGKMFANQKANDKQTDKNSNEIEELKKKVNDSVKYEQLEMMFNKFGDEIKSGFKAIMQEWELRLVNTGRLDPESKRKP